MSISEIVHGIVFGLFSTGVVLLTFHGRHRLYTGSLSERAAYRVSRQGFSVSEVLRSGGNVRIIKALTERLRRDREEQELYEGISYLRNTASIKEGREVSVNWILEELAESASFLTPVYRTFLQLVRANEREKAAAWFCQAVTAPSAKDYCRLLLQWDELGPKELEETLLSYQKSLRETRASRQKKRDEMVSDLIYLPVVMNVMVILINFIYVAYFIEQKEMLFTLM